ncbi:unnamed protein product [Calicophoron daubneyi]|uniref:RING-type E3 ubiquitin transferase n=1 Tax=Calicophoron daubneyi TaxID=300641 RepID=A0AAV2T698_CALDB
MASAIPRWYCHVCRQPTVPYIDEDDKESGHSERCPMCRQDFIEIISDNEETLFYEDSNETDILPVLMHLLSLTSDASSDGVGGPAGQLLRQLIRFVRHNAGVPPATKEELDRLPCFAITNSQTEQFKSCAICMEPYQSGESCMQMKCEHVFHTDCLRKWLEQHASCPMCRKDLSGNDVRNDDDDNDNEPLLFSLST